MESVVSNNDLKITNRNSNYINSKIDLLMQNLIKFYSKEKHINVLLPIVLGQSDISLRIIDWFVTNYCKKYKTIVDTFKDEIPVQIIVHLEYKNQLKAYSKKQFDPFCRRERISFMYNKKGDELETTVGQLNFFRWIIENNIIDYIKENLKDIDTDMNTSIRNHYKSNNKEVSDDGKKNRRKRKELSISATKSVSKHNMSIVVEFS